MMGYPLLPGLLTGHGRLLHNWLLIVIGLLPAIGYSETKAFSYTLVTFLQWLTHLFRLLVYDVESLPLAI